MSRGRVSAPIARPLPLAALVVAAALFSLAIGAARVPLDSLGPALLDEAHPLHRLIWEVRAPRIVLAALVGMALGLSGAVVQTAVRNPLADPGLLGVTSGSGLGALLCIVFAPEHTAWLPVCAMAGGLAAVTPVLSLASRASEVGGAVRLILVGVAINAVFGAGIALITFFFADRAPAYVSFTIGSLNGRGWSDVRIVAPALAVGAVALVFLRRSLDILLLDDASAMSVGAPVRLLRFATCALAAALAGAAVSVAGLVGFVGLIVPNWLRLAVGPEHGRLLPACALGGALLVLLADSAARTVAAPLELPVGALLALIGGPYFLLLVLRRVA